MFKDRPGRSHIAIGAALFILASSLTTGMALSFGGKPGLLLGRFVFDILLALLMIRGTAWARWVVVALCGLGAVIMASTIFKGAGNIPTLNLLTAIGMEILFLISFGLLAFSPTLSRYFREPPAEELFSENRERE